MSHVLLIALEAHALLLRSEAPSALDMKYYQIIIVQRRSVPRANASRENVKEESALLVTAQISAIVMSVLPQDANLDLVRQEHVRLVLVMWVKVKLDVRRDHAKADIALGLSAMGMSTMDLSARVQNVLLLDAILLAMDAVAPQPSAPEESALLQDV